MPSEYDSKSDLYNWTYSYSLATIRYIEEEIHQIKREFQISIGATFNFPSRFSWFWKWLKMYVLLLLLNNVVIIITYASSIVNSNFIDSSSKDAYLTLNPFMDLARVLDIQPIYQHNLYYNNNLNNKVDTSSAPEYFIKLYKSLSRSNGEGVGSAPYNADAIFGLMDSETHNQRYFKYEIDEIINQSAILNSEMHLYRLPRKKNLRAKRDTRFLIIKLYLVTSLSRKNTFYGNKLIDVQRVSINQYGWIVLNLNEAISKWIIDKKMPNYGLYVTIQNTDGTYASQSTVVFAQNSMRHKRRLQPIVSIYTKQKSNSNSPEHEETELSKAFSNLDPSRYQKLYNGEFYVPPRRVKRSENIDEEDQVTERRKHCTLYPMQVDFDKMGWNQWIIGPRSFNAGVCAGPCPYPLGQSYHPTNHAVVQSIWYHLNPNNNIIGPVCCVPHTLKKLRMLYYNTERVVVLKTYDNMIVQSCGCK